MNFHRHSRDNKYIPRAFWGLFVLIIGILVLNIFTNQSISKLLQGIVSPIWKIESKVLTSSVGSYFVNKSDLLKENKELLREVEQKKIELLNYPLLKSENEELKLLLGRVSGDTRLLGVVLVPPHRNKYDTLLIDAGESQPISIGDLVVAHPEVPIGTISSIGGETALVTLFSDPKRETDALLSSGEPVVLIGRGAGNFYAEVPRATSVNVGDVVRLPSLESRVVGVVGKVNSNPADSFQTLLVNSPINIFSLRFVEIIVEN